MTRRAARPLVYEGPKGRCSCCDRFTEISTGRTTGSPSALEWTVPYEVMRAVYSGVGPLIREKVTQSGQRRYYLYDPQLFATGRATKRNKLYFVKGDEGNIAGPFGPEGLKVFFGKIGRDDQLLYVVSTTHRSLSLIKVSPLVHLPPEDEHDDSGDDEDLF